MKKNIVVVDFDQSLNKINEKVLRESDIVADLQIFTQCENALEYLKSCLFGKKRLPDIIVFELQMPSLNGFDFIDRLALLGIPKQYQVQLVVYTASSSPRDKQKALEKGITHYLNKPFLLRSLCDIVLQLNRARTIANSQP